VPAPQTILVAYDDPTTETLGRAADLAEAVGARLVVTTVAASADAQEVDDESRFVGERLGQAETYLAERGLSAELVPSTGHPAKAIVKLARDRGADLIVVGTRRKGFLERLVEGSVQQDVLRHAPCDVLVVYS
jgi:nucleotide-binding universal stress UspA family protein